MCHVALLKNIAEEVDKLSKVIHDASIKLPAIQSTFVYKFRALVIFKKRLLTT
jgi:hypothetical protein